MRRVPLSVNASVVLDGTGAGTASIGPTGSVGWWEPETVSVKTSTSTAVPKTLIYVGEKVSDLNFVDGTYSGASNSSTNVAGQQVHPGFRVFSSWSGGDAGATATLTVTGKKVIP